MRTQKEVNHYLQENTVHVAAIYDIVKYLKDFNLKLPNNVILHEKGINQVDFFKWFENRCYKDGDVCTTILGTVFIYQSLTTSNFCGSYVSIDNKDILNIHYNSFPEDCCRFATEEEKQKLFDTIKVMGYRWNTKTNTLEKLIKPIFKKGDKVRVKNGVSEYRVIDNIEDTFYSLVPIGKIDFTDQDRWELIPNKFDISTLKPFDKVLVRDYDYQQWSTAIYSHKQDDHFVASGHFKQCIPYKNNEYLLGTTEDCDKFYKIWE